MYQELKSEDWTTIIDALDKLKESAEPVQVTLNKRDGLYQAVLFCSSEPEDGPTA